MCYQFNDSIKDNLPKELFFKKEFLVKAIDIDVSLVNLDYINVELLGEEELVLKLAGKESYEHLSKILPHIEHNSNLVARVLEIFPAAFMYLSQNYHEDRKLVFRIIT